MNKKDGDLFDLFGSTWSHSVLGLFVICCLFGGGLFGFVQCSGVGTPALVPIPNWVSALNFYSDMRSAQMIFSAN